MTSVDKMLPQTIQTLFPTTSMADVRGMPITYTSDGQVKNYHYDMLWDFASTETGKIGNSHIVSFTPTNAMYRKDIQDVLYHLHGWMKQRNKIAPTSALFHLRVGEYFHAAK